jgi:uncharacterized membrane protein YoaK (UPF0700 family)
VKQLWRGLVADPRHGLLPLLLVGLTVVTGVVDAVSILRLGRVFVANMTGNVVFVGFALAGAPGFSLVASLFALAGFLFGAGIGGTAVRRWGERHQLLLAVAVGVEFVLILAALILAAVAGRHLGSATTDALAAMAAVAMGLQNAVARRLAVPDLTTTVLTMTLTGIAADLRVPSARPAVGRRVLAVAGMLGGAVLGALLVLHVGVTAALGLAAGLLAALFLGSLFAVRGVGAGRTP